MSQLFFLSPDLIYCEWDGLLQTAVNRPAQPFALSITCGRHVYKFSIVCFLFAHHAQAVGEQTARIKAAKRVVPLEELVRSAHIMWSRLPQPFKSSPNSALWPLAPGPPAALWAAAAAAAVVVCVLLCLRAAGGDI